MLETCGSDEIVREGARRMLPEAGPEHWVHLRTTNPIESTFATVWHRSKATKGPGSRAAGLAVAFKLIQAAPDKQRMVNALHLAALVRAGATFINGTLVERPGEKTQEEPKDLDPQVLTIARPGPPCLRGRIAGG